VQAFFAHRIHALSGNWWITIISWMGSLLGFAATTAITVCSLSVTVTEFNEKYRWLTTTGLCLLLFVDVVNTTALCFYLRMGRTGFSSTDSMLNKLFVWTLETGLLTSLAAVLMLVFSLAMSKTLLWICISIFYAKLYSNSFMATLNGRSTLRAAAQSKGEIWSAGARPSAMMMSNTQTTSHVVSTGQVQQHRPSIDIDIPKASFIDPLAVNFEFEKTRKERESGSSSSSRKGSYGGGAV